MGKDEWFTVEALDDDTLSICEYGHWEEPHCYLLCGTQRAALIDTGLGVASLAQIVEKLTMLPVTVLTTHAQWDHIGSHHEFAEISVHEAEADWLSDRFPLLLEVVKRNLLWKDCVFPNGFSIHNYTIFCGKNVKTFRDGDIIDLGNRKLTVFHTPGHSPGHCCFYEAARQDLYTGDLIYQGRLDALYPTTDPVQFYLSVQKIRRLNTRRILPGHHFLKLSTDLVEKVKRAFTELAEKKVLFQGSGLFDYGDFQIHI